MTQVTYMHDVMNSNNILSLSGVLLLGIIFVVTLGIGEQMAKAGLVNDNSITGFAGQSKIIQRTVIAVVGVNTRKALFKFLSYCNVILLVLCFGS